MARSGGVISLSLIVPTPDGEGLSALFDSIRPQLSPQDEVLIVGDTHSQALEETATLVQAEGFRWLEHDAGKHAWGHPQVNYGISQAQGDYLVFNDDDDTFTESALAIIRDVAAGLPEPAPMMFRFLSGRNGLLWDAPVIQCGRIGGHEFVCPNDPERLGRWSDRYEGDFDFIESTLALWPKDSLVWREEVIAHAR
ncbi:MAG TPA: glycosyltransferase family A protein [Vicinamibacteria bacterium]|nr:glycosyltransferase family A protein [Vicinamibacteria bacterium]